MDSELMTVFGAAKYLKVASSTIYRWVYAKLIPVHRMNGCLRFYRSELDDWVKEEKE